MFRLGYVAWLLIVGAGASTEPKRAGVAVESVASSVEWSSSSSSASGGSCLMWTAGNEQYCDLYGAFDCTDSCYSGYGTGEFHGYSGGECYCLCPDEDCNLSAIRGPGDSSAGRRDERTAAPRPEKP